MNTATQTESEIIARRETFDGVTVFIHADGALSTRMHFVGRAKLPASDVWAVAAEVCTYTYAELPGLIRSVKSGAWQKTRAEARQRAASNARPEGERIYKTRDLANGFVSFIRIH